MCQIWKISICKRGVFGWLKVTFGKQCKEKMWKNGAIFRNKFHKLLGQFSSNLVCRVTYMEGTKYVYLIEIGPMVRDMRGWKRQLAVPVNNTLVHHMAFLAADTWPCVLMSRTVANYAISNPLTKIKTIVYIFGSISISSTYLLFKTSYSKIVNIVNHVIQKYIFLQWILPTQ